MKKSASTLSNHLAPSPRGICLVERTVVAGLKHAPRARLVAGTLSVGSSLMFERDLTNPYDKHAVKVLTCGGLFLGYLSCEFNEIVSRLIDGGKHLHATVSSIGNVGSWTKVEMSVVLDD